MAAVESVSVGAFVAGTTITITKPSGLAVGDLMLFHYMHDFANSGVMNTLSGWTHDVDNVTIATRRYGIQYKVADAGDVAASDFTFTTSAGGGTNKVGAIYCISNFHSSNLLNDVAVQVGNHTSGTLSFAGSVTPLGANPLLIFLVHGASLVNTASTVGVSGYAIATSNPTWASRYDTARAASGGTNWGFAAATAERAASTATGNYQIDNPTNNEGGTSDYAGVLISIDTPVGATGTTALHTASPTFFAPTGSAGTSGTTDLLDVSPTFFEPNGKGGQPTNWSNEQGTNTDWQNETL